MRVLLVTPPMVQFNTPYPAVPVLAAHLRALGHDVGQEDLSLALALRIFSSRGLREIRAVLRRRFADARRRPPAVRHLLRHGARCADVVDDAVRFLQGRAPELAAPLASRRRLPEGPRFAVLDDVPLDPADPAGSARRAASLFLDDLADAVGEGVDPRFALARYAERLAADRPSFDPLARALAGRRTLLDRWIDELADAALRRHRPQVLGLTVPFPGTVYGAFRIAARARRFEPRVRTILGGGYVNTELREPVDARVFDFFDFITLDDGETPLRRLMEHLAGRRPVRELVRTLRRVRGRVAREDDPAARDVRHREKPAPDLRPAANAGYLGMAESANPMHRLWSERPWIKLQLAHGCYWRRCAFCDTRLDYIRRFDPADADTVIAWMERAMADTGQSGFHFVDEAAPPALLRALADRILARGLRVEWWANIRFERTFTPALARRLAQSGCVAVTGGLECAHDRLLRLMDKGLDLARAARVTHAFSRAGVMVHAYLMYGFPTQTAQDTVDGLEYVRQLFASDCIQSAYWHRFALTVHSRMFQALDAFGLPPSRPWTSTFARNEAPADDPSDVDHDALGRGLRKATYNFMHGVGLREDVRVWFDLATPPPRLPRRFVRGLLAH